MRRQGGTGCPILSNEGVGKLLLRRTGDLCDVAATVADVAPPRANVLVVAEVSAAEER